MSEVRKLIRYGIKSVLENLTQADDRVFVNRKIPLELEQIYPAILVYSGDETASRITQFKNAYTRVYAVTVEVRLSHSAQENDSVSIDDTMDDIAAEVEDGLRSFAMNAVKAVVYTGAEPTIDDDGDTIMGSIKLNYEFTYIL